LEREIGLILRVSWISALVLAGTLIFVCSAASATYYLYVSTNGTTVNVVNMTDHVVEATIGGFTRSGTTAISPDHRLLFVTDSQFIRVIDTSNNTVVRSIPFANTGHIRNMVVDDDYRLYVTDGSRYVNIYDGSTGNYVDRIDSGNNIYAYHIALSPDSEKVYISTEQASWRWNISAYDTQTRALIEREPVDRNVTSLDAAGDRVYVGVCDGPWNQMVFYLYGYDAADLSFIRSITLPVSIRYVVVKPDASMVYVVSQYDRKLSAVKGDLSGVDQTFDLYKGPTAAAISPDGKKVYTFSVEWIMTRDTGDYSLDSFSTYYNVRDMEAVQKGLKFPIGRPVSPVPLIIFSPTPTTGPASTTPVPPSPTLTPLPPSPGPAGNVSPSATLNATPAALPSTAPNATQNASTASPTARPTPGFDTLVAIVCMAGALIMGRKRM